MDGMIQSNAYGEVGGGETSQIPDHEGEETVPFLVFRVGSELFATAVEAVREVIRVPRVSWVPGAHVSVLGVINLRGSIIAVLDLGYVLGVAGDDDSNDDCRIIVIESEGVTVGVEVDSVIEVANLQPSELRHAMRTLDEGQRSIVVSQTTIGDRIVGVLDIGQVVERARNEQAST